MPAGAGEMRVFLVVLVLGVIAVLIALTVIGAFPPKPHPAQVEHVLPNSGFRSP
ncbi:MAG TPA: hypothetical protein VHY76_06420 [Acetobacteraceae bacterium]|jgi:hypothetical protein|nr:hypothetical protein [Acetobacteraceae bacterium]